MTTNPLDRRRFLGLLGAAGLTAPLLAACGDSKSGTATAPASAGTFAPPTGTVRAGLQLGWLPNAESAPFLTARQRGYYSADHVDVTIRPGGPTVNIAPMVVSGTVLCGILTIERLADAVLQGAKLKAVGALVQTSSSCVLSLAKNPVRTPKDLEGKRFGVSASDAQTYGTFFKIAGVDASKVTMVQTNADPAALVSGDVDAMSAVIPNQPVALARKGVATHQLRLADFGYYRWSNILVVAESTLADPVRRAATGVLLKGTQHSLADQLAAPDAAAQIVVDLYGRNQGLDLPTQKAAIREWNKLYAAAPQNGSLRITSAGVERTGKFLADAGVRVDASKLVDLSLGDEVFRA